MIMRGAIWTFVIVHQILQICELMLSLNTRQYITMQEIEWYSQGILGIKKKYLKNNQTRWVEVLHAIGAINILVMLFLKWFRGTCNMSSVHFAKLLLKLIHINSYFAQNLLWDYTILFWYLDEQRRCCYCNFHSCLKYNHICWSIKTGAAAAFAGLVIFIEPFRLGRIMECC